MTIVARLDDDAQRAKFISGEAARRRFSMRLLSISLVVGVFAAMTVPAAAQSPTSYPWCARTFKMDSGGTSCYFTSYRQCMTTLSGLGGYCFESPYYHAPATKVRARAAR
jgi:hypothetical protein